MEKNFEFGLVLGRFHHLHNGHAEIIDISRKLCKKTLILIGSAKKSGTLRNPFKFETRKKVISRVYDYEDVVIGGIEDMTNENDICCEWGCYILENIEKTYGRYPDLMLYGNDSSRQGWFSEADRSKFSELILTREKFKISATQLRGFLVQDNKTQWKKYTPEKIWDMYDELRAELINLECYKK